MRAANLALKFLLELGAIAALAYWGANTGSGAMPVVLAMLAPAAMIIVWGLWCAPRAERRLEPRARTPLELGIFALAAGALIAAGATLAGLIFGALAVVNAALLSAFGQWDE